MKLIQSILELIKRFRFFIIFSAIGVLCVLIDYAIYMILWKLSGQIILPKIGSSVISVSVNYLLNSKFNFNNKQKLHAGLYSRYLGMYAVLIGLNTLINYLLVNATGLVQLSFWLSAVVAAFTNYFAVKIFFRRINLVREVPSKKQSC